MSEVAGHEPTPAQRAELLDLEARRAAALIDVDLDALDNIFDDSIVHIHAPGLTHNKAQLLEHTSTRRAYVEISRGELNIRVFGQPGVLETAVITGPITNRLRTAEGDERTLAGVATQVAARGNDGNWRYVSFQMTPYGEQAWPALASEKNDPTTIAREKRTGVGR